MLRILLILLCASPALDKLQDVNGVKFRESPPTRSDAASWKEVSKDKWGIVWERTDEPHTFLGKPVERILYTEGKAGSGIGLVTISIKSSDCGAFRKALTDAWGPSEDITAGNPEWLGRRLDADLDSRGGKCVLQIADRGWDDERRVWKK